MTSRIWASLLSLALALFVQNAAATKRVAPAFNTFTVKNSSAEPHLEDWSHARLQAGIALTRTTISRSSPISMVDRQAEYDKCLSRGTCLMWALDWAMPPSTFTSFEQLTNGPWQPVTDRGALNGLEDLFGSMSWDVNDFRQYSYTYAQPWISAPERIGGTWTAMYTVWVSTGKGAIISTLSYAPKDPIANPAQGGTSTPILRRWSDFAFLCWQHACQNDWHCMQGLEWVVQDSVRNQTSLRVSSSAVSNVGGTWSTAFPGTYIGMDREEGKAMLGTPNGWGVAWMLGQHVIPFGAKTAASVTVFENNDLEISFIFHVVESTDALPTLLATSAHVH